MHFFIDYVRSRVPTWKVSSGGWITGNCPVCVRMGESRPDTKQRGGFQFGQDEWAYHCFNCKFKTRWTKGSRMSWGARTLLEGFGIERSALQRLSMELMREEEAVHLLNPLPEAKKRYVPDWPEVDLPKNSTSLVDTPSTNLPSNFEQGITMLADRNLTHWSDWAYTADDFKYRKRMILPYRYKNKIVGHNSRYIGNIQPAVPKYLVTKPPHFVFNLDGQISDRNTVIVVEGDFDAISIDGVALGSNSLSDEQASLINQLNKKVVLLPDADSSGNVLIEPAIKEGWGVSFPEWMKEFKDANAAAQKYGRAFVLCSILAAVTDNPTKIRVLAKKYLRDD